MSFRPAPRGAPVAERLARFPFRQALSRAVARELEQVARPVHAERGTCLLRENDACDPLLFVERGAIRVSKTAADGKEIVLYRVEPGETCVLALTGATGGTPYPAHAEVERPVDAVALPADAFRRAMDREPALRAYVTGQLADRLAEALALVAELAFESVDRRLVRHLLRLACPAPGAVAPVERTHEELAHDLGTAREVVSRILRSLAAEGLIEQGRGRIVVVDPARLAQRADAGPGAGRADRTAG